MPPPPLFWESLAFIHVPILEDTLSSLASACPVVQSPGSPSCALNNLTLFEALGGQENPCSPNSKSPCGQGKGDSIFYRHIHSWIKAPTGHATVALPLLEPSEVENYFAPWQSLLLWICEHSLTFPSFTLVILPYSSLLSPSLNQWFSFLFYS